ncbi:MAG TPA: hypothetical protein VFR11_03740 [Micromonosporaceae bacterium]|nr:hypothetical protein [Micromonosporaceae bacterium]
MTLFGALVAAALLAAGCAQGGGQLASGRVVAPVEPGASGATPGPSTRPSPTASSQPIPKPPGRAATNAIPSSATEVIATLTTAQLTAITDRDVFGPVTVRNASVVAKAAAAINSQEVSRVGPIHCAMQGPGAMTLQFRTSNGTVLATAVINTSGCPGVMVRPASGGVLTLSGGADLVAQLESILGVDWPRPSGQS